MGRKRVIDDQRLLVLIGKGLNHSQIADELGVGRSTVTKAIKRLEESNPNLFCEVSVDQFKLDEADHLAKARMYIANLILPSLQALNWKEMTPEMLRKLGLLSDKFLQMERLIRGESTSNQFVGVAHKYDPDQLEDMKKIAKQLSSTIVEQSIPKIEYVEGEVIDDE
jgi:DNA-binding MarR family transcriptional regulator